MIGDFDGLSRCIRRAEHRGLGLSPADDARIRRRIAMVQADWDEDTRYRREHGCPQLSSRGIELRRSRPTIDPPRFRGFADHRRRLGSVVGLGYDQHDMYFDYLEYVIDHDGDG